MAILTFQYRWSSSYSIGSINNLTAIQVRGFVADNPTQERVVIKTDMAGWQQVGQVMKEYGIA